MVNTKYLIICVNYNSDEATKQFINSALNLDGSENLQIVCVDNSENREKKDLLYQISDHRVQVIIPTKNLGYFGGANYGLDIFLKNNSLPEWVIVSNVDITLTRSNLFEELDNNSFPENVGIVAPSIIVKPNDLDQNPFMKIRPSLIKVFWYRIMFRYYILCRINQELSILKRKYKNILLKLKYLLRGDDIKEKVDHSLKNKIEKIYAPHGSFIIFSKKFFLEGGSLIYDSFLFWEEIFVAEITINIGLDIIYYPKIVVSHEEHISTGNRKSRKMFNYARDSVEFCCKSFFC